MHQKLIDNSARGSEEHAHKKADLGQGFLDFVGRVCADTKTLGDTLKDYGSRALIRAGMMLPVPNPAHKAEQEAFIERYGIRQLGDYRVEVTLPPISRNQFLHEVQELSKKLFGRDHISQYHKRNHRWEDDPSFNEVVPEHMKTLQVDGNVWRSDLQTRMEQAASGLEGVELRDLAVAHGAFFILTGKDLFGGNAVRAQGGVLLFFKDGLDCFDFPDDVRSPGVAGARYLSPRS